VRQTRTKMVTKRALICGVLTLAVSVAIDLLAAFIWRGYNFNTDSAGQLTALGALTRPIVLPLVEARCLLLVAFGIGVWQLSGSNFAMRVTGALLLAGGGLWFLSGFFRNRLGETPPVFSLQVILGAAGIVFLPLAAILLGAAAFHSIGTLVLLAVLTVLGLAVQGEPHVGLQERVMGYGFLFWDAVLAVALLLSATPSAAAASSPLGQL